MSSPSPKPALPLVSMADLARELGVSMTTVSRALSDHYNIGMATKQRVQKLAKKLNYQPNHVVSALRRGQSRLLGVVVPYVEGKFFPAVIQGIEQATSKAGYSVIVCQSHEDGQLERRSLDTLLHHFDKVRQRGVPLVFFDRAPTTGAVNAVVLDDREGACQATHHLLAQGCRRVAHLAGPQHLSIYRERRQGYLAALQAAGSVPSEELIVYSDTTSRPPSWPAFRPTRACWSKFSTTTTPTTTAWPSTPFAT